MVVGIFRYEYGCMMYTQFFCMRKKRKRIKSRAYMRSGCSICGTTGRSVATRRLIPEHRRCALNSRRPARVFNVPAAQP